MESDKVVTVNIDARLKGKAVLQVFYLPVSEESDLEKNSLKQEVSALSHFQVFSFDIPDSIQIKKLRLDLSEDSMMNHLEIRKIFIKYNNKKVILYEPKKDSSYFKPNEYITAKGDQFDLHSVNGQFDPFIDSGDLKNEYDALLAHQKKLQFPFAISFVLVFSLFIYALLYTKPNGSMKGFYTFSSCFFVLLIFLPTINQLFNIYDRQNNEQRKLLAKPEFNKTTLLNFPKLYEAYFNDNFGLKNLLIQWNGKIRYYVFNTSIIPEKAAVGKDGWLFLNGSYYDITQELTKTNLYDQKTLKEKVKEWEGRKKYLESDSIGYYKAIWPDKNYIYPELLPFNMKILLKDTVSRTDQAINYLQQHGSPVKIIDVRAQLIDEKKRNAVYLKYDSHWNSYGAFIAYTELLQTMSQKYPSLKPHPLKDFQVTREIKPGGDLANILGIQTTELCPVFKLKTDSSIIQELPLTDYPLKSLICENKKASSGLTILIYRDSYTTALIPFLQPHFRKIILLWDVPYSNEMVKRVNPDIVLESYVTRYFR